MKQDDFCCRVCGHNDYAQVEVGNIVENIPFVLCVCEGCSVVFVQPENFTVQIDEEPEVEGRQVRFM